MSCMCGCVILSRRALSPSQAPRLEMPLHTVIRITYDGWNPPLEERFHLGPDITSDGQANL